MARERAFTVVELLIAVVIAGVLAAFAAPALHGLVTAHRGAAAMNQMVGAVAFARAQAVLRRQTVTLCPAFDDVCLGRHQWHRGALAFADHDGDGQRDPQDELLRAFPALPTGSRVYWRAFRNRSYLQFHARGYTRWQNGSFLYCPPGNDPALARIAVINAAGRVRAARDLDGDGIVNRAGGGNARCPP